MARRAVIRYIDARVIPDKLGLFDHSAILFVYSVDGVHVRQIHWSGKFNGPKEQLAAWLAHLAKKYNAHILTTTETQQRGAVKEIVEAMGPAFSYQLTGEYMCITRDTIFRKLKAPRARKAVVTRVRNWALWKQMHVGYFNVYHKGLRRRFRILVIHGPSGIEMGDHFKPGPASDVAKTGWPRIGRSFVYFYRTHIRAVQVAVADTNGDHFIPFWMNWFEDRVQAKSIWRGDLPKIGTHGKRLIDGAWVYKAK